MQNLKDVLACCDVTQGERFNQFSQFFTNIKFTVTGPDEDYKLCYSTDVNGLNSNRKRFKMIRPSAVVSNT